MNRRNFLVVGVSSATGLLPLVFWRNSYPFTAIEIKCWMQIDEKNGYETIPLIKLNNSNWFYAVADNNPLKLNNSYDYVITAPDKLRGAEFVSWQSEKTGMIIPSPQLKLLKGFESDTWWQNYRI